AHLVREVVGHHVHVVGQVLPGTGDARHQRLTTQLTFGTDLASQTRYLGSESVQLVNHRVDGFLQLQNLALHVHRDLARQVAARDGGRYLSDVTHLPGEVAGHRIDVISQVLPG